MSKFIEREKEIKFLQEVLYFLAIEGSEGQNRNAFIQRLFDTMRSEIRGEVQVVWQDYPAPPHNIHLQHQK